MEYNRVDPRAIKSWRIGQLIGLIVVLAVSVPAAFFLLQSNWESGFKYIILGGIAVICLYSAAAVLIFPAIEYRQWGYIVEEDKVVIRHGIFFIKETIIPVIRIQNITVSQGPINRKLGLYEVEIALASGNFSIEGLDKETADAISENLKSRLYKRVEEKGVL